MTRIGNIPEINAVKTHLNLLKEKGLVADWELPYEEILTRITAAVFFITPANESFTQEIWTELSQHKMLNYKLNEEKLLSDLDWRVEFNKGFIL